MNMLPWIQKLIYIFHYDDLFRAFTCLHYDEIRKLESSSLEALT